MSDAYGFLAPIYQPLSRVIFGKDLILANSVFSTLAQDKYSLIIGGGDGIAYRDWDGRFAGEYWDTSPKMTKLARRNLTGSGVDVNCGSWPGKGKFDVVFLPFVLDSLPDAEISDLILQISQSLNPGGCVILSDFFAPKSRLQNILQQLMITSFQIFARHPRRDLPDLATFFDPKVWVLLSERSWRKGWIRACVFGRIHDSMD